MPDPTQSVVDAMAEVRERTGPPPEPTPEQKALCDDGECGGCTICYGPGVPVFGPGTVIALADEVDRLSALLAGEGTTQPDAAEPTATQLYDAVKAKRYDRNAENPILTIPEIHAVLAARAEWLADRASGEGTAPPPDLVQVGWLRTDGAPTGRGPFYVLDDDPDCHAQDVADERLVPVYRLADRGTAPQVPAEVLWEGPAGDLDIVEKGRLYDLANVDVDARVRVVAADGAPAEADRG